MTQGESLRAATRGEIVDDAPPQEVLDRVLHRLAAGTLAMAYVAFVALMIAYDRHPRWELYLPCLLLALGSAAALRQRLPYALRGGFFTASLAAACSAAGLIPAEPRVLLGYGAISVAAGILLGMGAAAGATVAGSLSLLALALARPLSASFLWDLGLLWLTFGAIAASAGGVQTAIRRAQASERQAWRHAQEAEVRRGELARAKKALADMYDLLQRTNHELAVACREAEEAQHIKAQFAANISHELRTPLNLIMGFSDIVYHSPGSYGYRRWKAALSADLGEIYQASRHLLGMIDDILDLSRIEAQRLPLKLQETDLARLIHEAASTAAGLLRGKDVELRVSLPSQLPAVLADPVRIRQVILNLLNNAIRFTDGGMIEVSASAADGEVIVVVSDTGVGIATEDMATVFEEFGQAKQSITSGRGGAGLGLAVCKQFVQLHGGRIEAESEQGKGSTFRFRLPLPDSGRARSRLSYYAPEGWSPPVPRNPLAKTAVVLGPPGEPATALAKAISGYRILPLDDPGALAALVRSEHPSGVVLLRDPLLPSAWRPEDVWQAADRLDLPVVTCETPLGGVSERELGVAGYLLKPIQREQLAEAIRRVRPDAARFLVVDDDAGFVALIARMLGLEFPGAQVRGAYSGAEALELLQRSPFDVVILDLVMPGVSGREVIEALRSEESAATPAVIVTTASGYGEDLARRYPLHLELARHGGNDRSLVGDYIRALLDVAPPNYSRQEPAAARLASPAATPAS